MRGLGATLNTYHMGKKNPSCHYHIPQEKHFSCVFITRRTPTQAILTRWLFASAFVSSKWSRLPHERKRNENFVQLSSPRYNSYLIEMVILFLAGRLQLLPPSAHHVGRRRLGLRLEEAVQADQGAGRHDVSARLHLRSEVWTSFRYFPSFYLLST